MATTEVPDLRPTTRRIEWASVIGSLIAAALFLVAAALQLTASLQRWVVFAGSRTGDDRSVEDHLYDYSYPYEPWEPIGTAAQLYGAGLLLTAVGVLILPIGVAAMRRRRTRYRVVLTIGEVVTAALVAGALGIDGAHALISGLTGTPSPLQHTGAVGWVAFFGLIALGVIWHSSRAAVTTCAFLIGSTWLGYLLAAFVIAPLFAGGSHDTTRWTETVVAATTAAAGIAMLVGTWGVLRKTTAQTRPPK